MGRVTPAHAQEATQNGDYSMQMTADIIATLPLLQRRVGIRCLALGKQQLRGRPTAAANRAYPNVL
eukprot:5851-Amphidinium_carterae.1